MFHIARDVGPDRICVCRHGVGVGCHFKCTDDQGALLVIKESASREILQSVRRMQNHMAKNIQSWLDFASDVLELDMKLEHIALVIGFVKTTEWAVSAVTREGKSAKVSFNGDFGIPVQVSFTGTTTQTRSANWISRSGPPRTRQHNSHQHRNDRPRSPQQSRQRHRRPESQPQQPQRRQHGSQQQLDAHRSDREQPLVQNQCIFLHYLKMKKRLGFIPKIMRAAAEPRDPSCPPDDDDVETVVEQVPPVDEVRSNFTCRGQFDKVGNSRTIPSGLSLTISSKYAAVL